MTDELPLILLGVAALIGRVGLGLYLAGISRSKNAAAAGMRTLCDACVTVLAYWAIGNALFAGHAGFVLGIHGAGAAGVFFWAAIVLIATGAATGATLERARLIPPLIATAALAGIIVPLAAAWAWKGWLHRLGFIDVAGASFLHLAGGCCAAAGAMLVGPRTGKYNRDGSSNFIPAHNVPMAMAGMLALAGGIIPTVVGCALIGGISIGASALNAILSAAAGGMAGAIFGRFRYGKPDVHFAAAGLLAGMIASSAGAGLLASWSAVVIGALAGFAVPAAMVLLDLNCKIDDASGSVALHGIGGAWGLLAAGIFLPGSLMDRLRQVGIQLLGLLAIGALALGVSAGAFLCAKIFGRLRISEADEFDGVDLAEHDLNAYPDFQQTTIKSYHLREA